ncbi:hypothetical protein [Huintestinicola sp.]|uniref:hypothetical protein n=1 Tax=Huintestinicola sp. TaxID=2981661 RepID=UPI003D7EE2B5
MTEKTAKNNSLTVSDKVIKTHMLFIAGVCLIFGIVNLVSGAAAAGVVTIAIGVIIPAIVMILNKKLSNQVKGTILSQGQLLAIIIISAAGDHHHIRRKARDARNVPPYAGINGYRFRLL